MPPPPNSQPVSCRECSLLGSPNTRGHFHRGSSELSNTTFEGCRAEDFDAPFDSRQGGNVDDTASPTPWNVCLLPRVDSDIAGGCKTAVRLTRRTYNVFLQSISRHILTLLQPASSDWWLGCLRCITAPSTRMSIGVLTFRTFWCDDGKRLQG